MGRADGAEAAAVATVGEEAAEGEEMPAAQEDTSVPEPEQPPAGT